MKTRFFQTAAKIGLMLLLMVNSACFRRFQMTEKEIETFFADKGGVPPSYWLNEDNLPVHWVQTGSDSLPLLLFIHGAPGAWYGYIQLMANTKLKKHFALASVDRPGYHRSGKAGKQVSIQEQARLISGILRNNPERPVYILGRSYGAPIAAEIAARYPKQVRGLMLVAPAADPDKEKFWWFSPLVQYPPLRWIFPKPIRRASSEKYAHRRELRKMVNSWSEVTCPTQILQGGKDFIVYPSNACFVDSAMCSSQRLVRFLPENGHLITREQPELVVDLLIELKKGRLY